MKRIVVKIGTSLIARHLEVKGGGDSALQYLVNEMAKIRASGVELILVSSGAIGAGMKALEVEHRPEYLPKKQALASVGQVQLMRIYEDLFEEHETQVAQVLLTRGDFDDRKRYLNARHTLTTLLQMKVIPIINENDAVAVEEIRFGDNDQLSALVAAKMDAQILIILSDVEGLYRFGAGSDKELIRSVEKITPEIESHARPSVKGRWGTGGMSSKLDAAKMATASGVMTVIANGETKNILSEILGGKEVGTKFGSHGNLSAKKRWILFGAVPKGELWIDHGATVAVRERASSLLAPGIFKVVGNFSKGDVVKIIGASRAEIARGISSYSSQEIEKGGKSLAKEVIHRDVLALVG